ncbi:Predicted metal-dependent phosphoesterase TrpH, contains PHP domain [Halobellus limi]|uniref:Predicted metal-dependent phosphoesterase TrpH, contains PHP domain n=1 Tax=Halobellus limi TaxID=699433 RepID=A0A1H6C350_9EURY|nr:Predicted metal-dependent phosphoesterase TrpH, contains PHP domain [Halobellus limi]
MTDTAASGPGSEADAESSEAVSAPGDDTVPGEAVSASTDDAVPGETHVDLHVKVLNDRVVDHAKARGLDVLVYAPHFTRLPEIRARAESFSDEDLLVVPGREVFTGTWRNRRHVLAVGLSEPVPDFISLLGALDAFERQGAAVLVPHPEFLNVSLGADDLRAHVDRVDAVETHNLKLFAYQNRRARRLAREADRPGFGSSYAHLGGSVGEVWTAFDREIDSEADLVAALREGASRRILRRNGARHTARKLAEFAHLGYENSWSKIDRLFLSGMEPTHPDHVAYRGRFDDVKTY